MSDTTKKKLVFSSAAVDLDCGAGSSRRLKKLLYSIFHPKPKPATYRKHHNYKTPYFSTTAHTRSSYSYYPSSTSTSSYECSIPILMMTFSPPAVVDKDEGKLCGRTVKGFGRFGGERVAENKSKMWVKP
ncbi:unnamed protein product [Linum trigynum]|uniref:Uncharacterized protein n=1 Tax=Linum trigynum TaxID=586398 RepID=A0AAV2EAC8_9ROSI